MSLYCFGFMLFLQTVTGEVYNRPVELTVENCQQVYPIRLCPSGKFGIAGNITFPPVVQHSDCRVSLELQRNCLHHYATNSTSEHYAIHINIRKAELFGFNSFMVRDESSRRFIKFTGSGKYTNDDPESVAQFMTDYTPLPRVNIAYTIPSRISERFRFQPIVLDYILVAKDNSSDHNVRCNGLNGYMDEYFICNREYGRVNCPTSYSYNGEHVLYPAFGRQRCLSDNSTRYPTISTTPHPSHFQSHRFDYLWGITATAVLTGAIILILCALCSSKKVHKREIQYAKFTDNQHSAVFDYGGQVPTLTPDDIKQSFKPYGQKAEKEAVIPNHGEFFI